MVVGIAAADAKRTRNMADRQLLTRDFDDDRGKSLDVHISSKLTLRG
jgi:hypothetical protein